MAGKRANGEGTVYKRKDGRWTARISLPGGKRKDYFGKTRQEVATKLNLATKQRADGLPFHGEKLTVADFLNQWLLASQASIRHRTFDTYETILRVHVVPFLGKQKLVRLTALDLQKLYGERSATGLKAASVRKIHSIVHRALEQAVRWDLVPRNVADHVTPPRIGHREMQTLSSEQARLFLSVAQSDRLGALYVLAVTTGMRLGELLALAWKDIDLSGSSLSVRGTLYRSKEGLVIGEPKTAGSRRQISLGQTSVEALRRHKVNQSAERLLRGSQWEDMGLVFANENGRPIEDTNLRRRSFEPLLRRAGLPAIRFHDLRHTAATLLLSQGVHPKIVSERLGHSRVSITLDLYSHVTPTMQRQAAEAMEAVLRA